MELITILILTFIIGFSTAIFGIMVGSSGLIRIPLLILIGLPPQVAIASNKIGAIAMSLTGIYKYGGEKLIDYKTGYKLIAVEVIGAILGARLLLELNPDSVKKIIAIVIIIVVGVVIVKQRFGLERVKNKSKKHLIAGMVMYFFLSIYGGFMGGGAGTIETIILISCFGLTFLESAATRRLPGLVGSVAAALIFAFGGIINWAVAITLFVSQACGAWIGTSIAVKKGNMFVKIVFVVVALLLAIRLLTM